MTFGVDMRLRDAQRLFLDRQAVITRLDKSARRRLAVFGGYAIRTARNLIKPKRDMQAAEFPPELKALIGHDRLNSGKSKRAQKRSLKKLVQDWPQTVGAPGQPPKYTVSFNISDGKKFNRFKDLIIFVVDIDRRSVVMGPVIFDPRDIPGWLEQGGMGMARVPRFYETIDQQTGQPVILQSLSEPKQVHRRPRPYMSTAFDRALDAKVPAIFREIL